MMGPVPRLFRFIVLLMVFWLPVRQGWSAEGGAGGLALELRVGKSPVYVGEKVEISATLFVARAGVRNIGYPTLASPPGTLSAFSPPTRELVQRAGQDMVSYRFEAAFQPGRAGRFDLGPAELALAVPASAGRADAFFGGDEERSLTVRSGLLSLEVSPLPVKGRPPEFSGAVGRYDIQVDVAPRSLRVGQPFTLTTRIRGVGGFDKFTCPKAEPDGARAYPPTIVKSGREMVCEQVLLAINGPRIELPRQRIAYFNTTIGRYEVVSSDPIGVEVMAEQGGAAAAASRPLAREQQRSVGKMGIRPNTHAAYLLLGFALLVLVAVVLVRKLQLQRRTGGGHDATESTLELQTRLEEAEAALSQKDIHLFYLALFRVCQCLAASRSGQPPDGITAVDSRLQGVGADDHGIPTTLEALLRECDAVRYGLGFRDEVEMRCALEQVLACARAFNGEAGSRRQTH